ncbi:MAG TPA: SAM-dependent methyltransferase [Steroidobacteraceae bacterium]|nr:SAM-dependent methyltransferase [Steroidobacteraceae bacterium]
MIRSGRIAALPALGPEEADHSRAIEALIRRRIAESGGWIDFETFMDLALYAPGLGYYSAGATKFGRAGDFVTAPEMSDLFSRCVARQCAQCLEALGGGQILELGAGTGRMAAVLLSDLAQRGALPARYAILEVSADLRERQQERIAHLPENLRGRVTWLEHWPQERLEGIVLANEVLDALACQRFVVHRPEPSALGVGLDPDGALIECERPAAARARAAIASLLSDLPNALPDGYVSELCLRIEPWIAALSEVLARGIVLLFDYGLPRAHYYHPERLNGTLRCHFRQRAHDDPLTRIGLQDITAWVDFTRVAEAAAAVGLDVRGFATQAAFLLGTGIEALVAESAAPAERSRLAGEARRLLLPGEMGEAFKAMALTRRFEAPLAGFAHQDLRGSL